MIYITSDMVGRWDSLKNWCIENATRKTDALIILGDTGITKEILETIPFYPVTIMCVHMDDLNRLGKHSMTVWMGGAVFCGKKYPNLLYAVEQNTFDINGVRCLALGELDRKNVNMEFINHVNDFKKIDVVFASSQDQWVADIATHLNAQLFSPATNAGSEITEFHK